MAMPVKTGIRSTSLTNVKWSTPKEQANNRRPIKTKPGGSGVKGVRQDGQRWRTVFTHNGERIYVGLFNNVETAFIAYFLVKKSLVPTAFAMQGT